MIDRNITQERYRETKEIVDRLILDADYVHSDEPYYDPDITMLEVLRIMFAYNMAKSAKKQRTEEQLRSFIDKKGIQAWLTWVHGTRDGGVDNGYGHLIESPESYAKSPGITRWTHFGVHTLNAAVSGPGRTTLYYNQVHKSFQETPCRLDADIIDNMCREIEKACTRAAVAGLIVPKAAIMARNLMDLMADRNRNSMAAIRIPITGTGGTMLINHDPFAFQPTELARRAEVQATSAPLLEPMRKEIETIVDCARWPEGFSKEVVLTVSGSLYGDDAATGAQRRVNIALRFDQVDHRLERSVVDMNLGTLDYESKDSAQRILERFRTCVKYRKKLTDEIKKTAKREATKAARRTRKAEKIGAGNLDIDHVARHLLGILKDHDADKHERVLRGEAVNVKIPLEELEGFIRGRSPAENARSKRKRTTETVSFKLEEGQMRARFHINDEYYWDKTRLRVGALPETALAGLPGKPARAVVDHPIADLLGPVSRAYKATWGEYSWITFTPIIQTTAVATQG